MRKFSIDEDKVRIILLRRMLEETSKGTTKDICDDHLFYIEQKCRYDNILLGKYDKDEMKAIIKDLKFIQKNRKPVTKTYLDNLLKTSKENMQLLSK